MPAKLPKQMPEMADVFQRTTSNNNNQSSSSFPGTTASTALAAAAAAPIKWLEPTYTLVQKWRDIVDRHDYIELRKTAAPTNEIIAIKKVMFSTGSNRESLRELRIANLMIVHPNIVRCHACYIPGSSSSASTSSSPSLSASASVVGTPATATATAVTQHQQHQQSVVFSRQRAGGGSAAVEVHLHMEYAERLCLARFCEDLCSLVEKNRMLNNQHQNIHQTTNNPTTMTKGNIRHQPLSSSSSSSSAGTAAASAANRSGAGGVGHHQQQQQQQQHPYSSSSSGGSCFLTRMIETCLKCVARQALCGLVALHCVHDTLHRDVKPGNILVFENGAVKLTDFGTAIADPIDKSATATGTDRYRAPEMATNRETSKSKVDVWSLGATVLFMKLRATYGLHEEHWPHWAADLDMELKTIGMQGFQTRTSHHHHHHHYENNNSNNNNPRRRTIGDVQQMIDSAIRQSFDDVGMRHLVLLMMRVDPQKRVSTETALAWSYALTPSVSCESSNRSNSSSGGGGESCVVDPFVGWVAPHHSQRNLAIEKELKDKFGIVCCDAVLQTECCDGGHNNAAVERKNQQQQPRLVIPECSAGGGRSSGGGADDGKSATEEETSLEASVGRIAAAISLELAGLRMKQQECATSESSPAEFIPVQLMYNDVLSRRGLEQVSLMQEILALTPPVRG